MNAAHSLRRGVAVAAALYLAVLGLLLLPGPATAQIVDYTLLLVTLAPPSQPAQDSPSGLRSPGERGVTRVWSAVEELPSLGRKHSKEICVSLPSAPSVGGVCSMTADELVAASRQAPKPPAGAPDPRFDVGQGAANAFSRMGSALSGLLDRPARPVPMRAADLAKAATGDFLSGHLESALDKAKQMLDASLSNRETAVSLGMIGRFCTALGRPEKADGVLDKALGITRAEGADGIKATAHILEAEGQLYRQQGKYEAAANAFKEALAIHQADEHDKRDVARILNQMALVSEETGDQAAALSLYERGIALARGATGPNDPELATMLANLGGLRRRQGQFGSAEDALKEALAVEERAGKGAGFGIAAIHNQWGLLEFDRGNYDKADQEFAKAAAIAETYSTPSNELSLAMIYNNLALLDRDRGDGEKALQLLRLSAEKLTHVGEDLTDLGATNTPRDATLLDNFADTYAIQGDMDCAEKFYNSADRIWEKLGPAHQDSIRAKVGLAGLKRKRGDLSAAEGLLQTALDRLEQRLGPDHPEVARTRNNLAEVLRVTGREDRSEQLYKAAASRLEQTLGHWHPDVATVLFNEAVLDWQRGAIADAVQLAGDAARRHEHSAGVVLGYGSEEQKRAFAQTLAGETAAVISLQAAARNDPAARTLALDAVIQRKGRVLDEASAIVSVSVRQSETDAETRSLLDEWRRQRTLLPALLLHEDHPGDSAKTEDRIYQIEQQLSRRNATGGPVTEPANVAQVRGHIPDAAALIEFAVYTPFAPKARETIPARYAAFVLRATGEPAFVDLGEAAAIDAIVDQLHEAMVYPDYSMDSVKQVFVGGLSDKLIAPLRGHLENARLLLIVPDGQLNLLSFAQLQDADRQFLIQRYELAYLASSRDLVRIPAPRRSPGVSVIVADPDYGQPGDTQSTSNTCPFPQLPETRTQASAIANLLPERAQVLVGGEATKEAVRAVQGPRILHLATHGFFADLARCGASNGTQLDKHQSTITASLLRSGLALAKANQPEKDGVLTAIEAASLDLQGTKLVVMSACDTGRGTVENGEGVLGLRRALTIAGAEAQLMSLWMVNKDATGRLIVDYYRRLVRGAGRAEALRAAQLDMITGGDRWAQPWYWAAFIPIGVWTPLGGI